MPLTRRSLFSPFAAPPVVIFLALQGISFLDDNLLVAVSDKMKSGGKQHYRCLRKDQSIHTFVLP